MSILIGHASIGEGNLVHGGQAGDQTSQEVYIRNWYAGGWNIVLRPKSAAAAEKMASACEILCRGNLVGYDQWQRNDLWDQLERVGWDPSKMKTACETDCSAFMTACARVAGINVPRVAMGGGKYNAPVTQTMRNAFGSTGAFDILTDSKYCTSDAYLKRGDILVRESGHTAMALGNGSAVHVSDSAPKQGNASGDMIYAVKPGDTLSSVAAKFGTTASELARLNGIVNMNMIRAGQVLDLNEAAVAIRRLANLGIINSADYWREVASSNKVKYLDALLIKVAGKIVAAGKRVSTAKDGITILNRNGVIDSPDYWIEHCRDVTNLDLLFMSFGGAVYK